MRKHSWSTALLVLLICGSQVSLAAAQAALALRAGRLVARECLSRVPPAWLPRWFGSAASESAHRSLTDATFALKELRAGLERQQQHSASRAEAEPFLGLGGARLTTLSWEETWRSIVGAQMLRDVSAAWAQELASPSAESAASSAVQLSVGLQELSRWADQVAKAKEKQLAICAMYKALWNGADGAPLCGSWIAMHPPPLPGLLDNSSREPRRRRSSSAERARARSLQCISGAVQGPVYELAVGSCRRYDADEFLATFGWQMDVLDRQQELGHAHHQPTSALRAELLKAIRAAAVPDASVKPPSRRDALESVRFRTRDRYMTAQEWIRVISKAQAGEAQPDLGMCMAMVKDTLAAYVKRLSHPQREVLDLFVSGVTIRADVLEKLGVKNAAYEKRRCRLLGALPRKHSAELAKCLTGSQCGVAGNDAEHEEPSPVSAPD